MPSEEVRRKLAQLAHGRNMSAEGTIPGRFPILMDPKRFHLANGHPNNEVTRCLCESSFGDPNIIKGYADKCPFCLSRRRRIQFKNRIETVDRSQWRMGEKWTLDFTAMCLKRSHDKNAVGILFEESVSSPGWKTRLLVLSRYGKTVYPSFESGGGTADHLTGSLLSN